MKRHRLMKAEPKSKKPRSNRALDEATKIKIHVTDEMVERGLQAILLNIFAPCEFPIDDKLEEKYRKIMRCILEYALDDQIVQLFDLSIASIVRSPPYDSPLKVYGPAQGIIKSVKP